MTLGIAKQRSAATVKGQYLAVGHGTSPFLTVYNFKNEVLTKLPNPSTLPAGLVFDLDFNKKGDVIAVASNASPYFLSYTLINDQLTRRSDPATLPTASCNSIKWNKDNTAVAMTTSASPYVLVYEYSGGTFTKLADPSPLPAGTGTVNNIEWSPDGNYIFYKYNIPSGPGRIGVIQKSGSTLTVMSDIVPNITDIITIELSHNGEYMIAGGYSPGEIAPFFEVHKISNGTSTSIITPSGQTMGSTTNQVISASWSHDDSLIAFGNIGNLFINIYSRSGDTFTREPVSTSGWGLISGQFDTAFNRNKTYMAHAGGDNSANTRFGVIRVSDWTKITGTGNPATFPLGVCRAVSWTK